MPVAVTRRGVVRAEIGQSRTPVLLSQTGNGGKPWQTSCESKPDGSRPTEEFRYSLAK